MDGQRAKCLLGGMVAAMLGAAVGCGGSAGNRPVARPSPAPVEARAATGPATTGIEGSTACARRTPGVGASRHVAVRSGSTVALARDAETGHVLAYVADADEPSLHTVDVDAGREIAVTRLHDTPEQAMVLGDGRVVVTLRQAGQMEVLEPAASGNEPLASRCLVDVPEEPIGLAATPDDASVLVTSGLGRALSVLDASSMARTGSFDVPREPRSVVVSDDGKRAFVAHVVGAKMSVVDLGRASKPRTIDLKMASPPGLGPSKTRVGCQGFALAKAIDVPKPEPVPMPVVEGPPATVAPPARKPLPPGPKPIPARVPSRIFAPFVAVDPGDPQRTTSGYGDTRAGLAAELSSVSVIDPEAERSITRTMLALPQRTSTPVADCILPRSATAHGRSLYVTCLGIDTLVELDARAVDPARAEIRRWTVAAGPTGVAVDPASDRAIVFSQFDRTISVVPLATRNFVSSIALSRAPNGSVTPEVALGRVLFHRTGDAKISRDGRACASCHPDGRDDALTWSTPEGPRQTVMLMGRVEGTAPYGWSGKNPTAIDHVTHTFQRLEGAGLPPAEVDALLSYITRMRPPAQRPSADGGREALVAHGRDLFHSAEAACSSCHNSGVDTDGKPHDVGSRAKGDPTAAFDTPSLRFIAHSAPYFHDGRYETLEDLLDTPASGMGHTAHLSREDRVALIAFLETL
jgi:DNA-binding beta-propeller fold protein YncE